jgi:tight adherence protein B
MPAGYSFLLLVGAVIALAFTVALLAIVIFALTNNRLDERLEAYVLLPDEERTRGPQRGRAQINRLRLRLNSMMSMFASEELSLRLMSANWPITESEYVLVQFWSAAAGLALGWIGFRSIFPGIGIAIITFLIPEILLRRGVHARRNAFEKQLVDVLVLVQGAVRAGYSFLQALDVVIEEMRPPVSDEFRRVRTEVNFGLPLSRALDNLNSRMQNDDLYLLTTSININSQTGGNLSLMLESVTNTIRERVRLFSEMRALTSQQRYSGYMLTIMPFIVAGVLFILNPEYIARIFEPGIILCVPIGALIFVLLGNIVIRYLGKIEV